MKIIAHAAMSAMIFSFSAQAASETDKRIPLDRKASKETIESCIQFHKPNLMATLANYDVSANLSKRLWLTTAGPAERILVTVNVSEKNRLEGGQATSMTCVLRGDETTDAAATREFQSGR